MSLYTSLRGGKLLQRERERERETERERDKVHCVVQMFILKAQI